VLFLTFANAALTSLGDSTGAFNHHYWIPFRNELRGPSGTANNLTLVSLEPNTVAFDYDANGSVDKQITLDRGQAHVDESFREGTRISSTAPLQASYFYNFYDHVAYEDGSLGYELLPEALWGTEYWIPLGGNRVAILSATPNNQVFIARTGGDTADETISLGVGQSIRRQVPAGARIWSRDPVYVVVANHSDNRYDQTYAYSVLPRHALSSEYFFPRHHPHGYQSAVELGGVHVIAVENGTTVTVDGSQRVLEAGQVLFRQTSMEGSVVADKDVFAVYQSRVQGRDPWRGVNRLYDYTLLLIPVPVDVREFVAGPAGQQSRHGNPRLQLSIVSHCDDNRIQIDCRGDGTINFSRVLRKGEFVYFKESDPVLACWSNDSIFVRSDGPIQVMLTQRGWWNSVTEGAFANAILGNISGRVLAINLPLTVSIVAPEAGSQFAIGSKIPITAEASDPDGTVELVGFYANGVRIGPSFTEEPYTFVWEDAPVGTHVLTARARDNDGALSTSEPVTITVVAAPVNRPPSLSHIAAQTILEDHATAPIPFTIGDAETPAIDLEVSATSSNLGLVPQGGIVLGGSGTNRTITLTPAPDQFGVTTMTLIVRDAEGLTATNQFELTVVPVNDPPAINQIPDQFVLEDSPEETVPLSGISAGPANESDQTLTITAESNNPGVVPHPTVDYTSSNATGLLRFRPVPDANGTARITVRVKDSGGTANGGIDETTLAFNVTVRPVNDAPSFAKGPDIAVMNRAGPQTVPGWATNIRAGPPDEASQTLTFELSPDRPELFATLPALSASGTLTFAPAPGTQGVSAVTVVLRDDGGTDFGGVDTSPEQTFTITVTDDVRPPAVRLVRPLDYTGFAPREGRTTVDVWIEAEASADEGVERVEFYAGATLLGAATAAPYRFEWKNVAVGEYRLSAVVTDNRGLEGRSDEARIAVSDLGGDVAIIRDGSRPEIDALRDYLFQMGLGSRLFDPDAASFEALDRFRLVILHLGLHGEVSPELISTLGGLRQSFGPDDAAGVPLRTGGMPLFIIGERIGSAASTLSQTDQDQWAQLCRLSPLTGIQASQRVTYAPEMEAFKIVKGIYGDGEDFTYERHLETAGLASDATVWATAGEAAVFLTYPAMHAPDVGEARGATQNFQLLAGADGDSLTSRKAVFQNTVCWLLRCSDCTNASLNLEAVTGEIRATAGEVFRLPLLILNNGACEARASRLRLAVPAGLEFLGAEVSRGGNWTYDAVNRRAQIEIGIVGSGHPSGVAVELMLGAVHPGEYDLPIELLSNNTLPGTRVRGVVVGGDARPVIRLERLSDGRLRLHATGAEGRAYEVHQATTLASPPSWTRWAGFTGPDWSSAALVPESNSAAFYRIVSVE
jgi:hypothetical protein